MNRICYLNQKTAPYQWKFRTFCTPVRAAATNNAEKDISKTTTGELVKKPAIPTSVNVNQYLQPLYQPRDAVKQDKVICFDDVPGPSSLRLISKFWEIIPVIGNEIVVSSAKYLFSGGKFFGGMLSWGGNPSFFNKFFRVYGPVVRLHGAYGSDVVLLSRPEHASAIFQNEGPYPVRSCMESVEKYHLDYKKYRHTGPFAMHGPDWEKLRKSIEIPLHSVIVERLETIDGISNEFIERIIRIRNKQEEMPNYFKIEIMKWALECLCSLTVDKKLGFLDLHGLSPNSDASKLLESLNNATQAISKCEYGFQFWRFFQTPAFKFLTKNCEIIENVLEKHVGEAIKNLQDKNEVSVGSYSFLETLVSREKIYVEDIMTILLDMFLIGANATVHTVSFLMYHLAKNPRCQLKLYEETKSITKALTKDDVCNLSYFQCCLKETLRVNPPMPILSRILNKDVMIHQYPIPKGTYVLFANHLNSTSEEYFEDATKFKPERWLSNELGGFGNDYQAFASMPFGYGAKSCFAKEMVNMQIATLMVKISNRFKIEYNYGDIHSSNKMLAYPEKPLKFRFIDRI